MLQYPANAPPAFHLLAKPTGAICNLDCAYCFFLDKEVFYPNSKFRMSEEVLDNVPAIYIAQALTAQQIQSFVEFPPRQKPASFNLDAVLEQMQHATDGGLH